MPRDVRSVSVVLGFPCRICGLDTPLNHVPSAGMARCLRCGREQDIGTQTWDAVLSEAHAVVDNRYCTEQPACAVQVSAVVRSAHGVSVPAQSVAMLKSNTQAPPH
jgi:hypothetical protein